MSPEAITQPQPSSTNSTSFHLNPLHDALVIIDVQNDFLTPLGNSTAKRTEYTTKTLNALVSFLRTAHAHNYPIFTSRDWHPGNHCSFSEFGGPWPAHCIAASSGAEYPEEFPKECVDVEVKKGVEVDKEAYSAFKGTPDLSVALREWKKVKGQTEGSTDSATSSINRVVVCGWTTEYCVRSTVEDALQAGFDVVVLDDLTADMDPVTGVKAREDMGKMKVEVEGGEKSVGVIVVKSGDLVL
ncbi:hypothetical protein HK102_001875 [Quaeritorhiza haematococci]|nr:hypothetical protein HK102_001875 [Quaeritorhiza haematococci]